MIGAQGYAGRAEVTRAKWGPCEAWRRWSSQPWNGSTGSITGDFWSSSGTDPRQRSKRRIVANASTRRAPRASTKTVSGIPGTVQIRPSPACFCTPITATRRYAWFARVRAPSTATTYSTAGSATSRPDARVGHRSAARGVGSAASGVCRSAVRARRRGHRPGPERADLPGRSVPRVGQFPGAVLQRRLSAGSAHPPGTADRSHRHHHRHRRLRPPFQGCQAGGRGAAGVSPFRGHDPQGYEGSAPVSR